MLLLHSVGIAFFSGGSRGCCTMNSKFPVISVSQGFYSKGLMSLLDLIQNI